VRELYKTFSPEESEEQNVKGFNCGASQTHDKSDLSFFSFFLFPYPNPFSEFKRLAYKWKDCLNHHKLFEIVSPAERA